MIDKEVTEEFYIDPCQLRLILAVKPNRKIESIQSQSYIRRVAMVLNRMN